MLERLKEYAKTDRIALINREERLRFTELDARSEEFAAWLLERFGSDRTPVVIVGHKESDFLPCIFGALKSGRAYVPVEPSVPSGRLAEIVVDVAPKILVDFSGSVLETSAVVLSGGELEAILHAPPKMEIPREVWVSGDDTAYILFTSGSTGRPKGVPITGNNLTNFYKGILPFLRGDLRPGQNVFLGAYASPARIPVLRRDPDAQALRSTCGAVPGGAGAEHIRPHRGDCTGDGCRGHRGNAP